MLETELIFQALMYNVKLGSLEEPPKIEETFLLPGNWFHTLSRKILKCIWNAKCWQFLSVVWVCVAKLFSIRGKEALSKLFEDWTLPVLLLQSVLLPGDIAVMLEDPEPPHLGFGANWSYGVRMGFCSWSYRNCLRRKAVHTYNIVRKIEPGSQLKKKHEEV